MINALYPWQEELLLLAFFIIYGGVATVSFGFALDKVIRKIKSWLKG
jgi:hypothetical protein